MTSGSQQESGADSWRGALRGTGGLLRPQERPAERAGGHRAEGRRESGLDAVVEPLVQLA